MNEPKVCCADSAVVLFEQIVAILDRTADEMKIQSAEASLEGDFARVNAIATRFERLLSYRKKLLRLEREWPKVTTLDRSKSRTKQKGKQPIEGKMRVIFNDETIEQETNQDTFIAALTKIGLERVMILEKMVNDLPLVSYVSKREKHTSSAGEWCIQSDISDALKRKLLRSIAKKFSIDLNVEFIPGVSQNIDAIKDDVSSKEEADLKQCLL